MNVLEQRIDKALRARHPILFLHSHEEDRVMQSLESIANDRNGLYCWTCTQGLDGSDEVGTTNPVVAIQEIIRNPRPGFFVFKDLTPFMDDPALLRVLRDAYHALHKVSGAHLIILSPVLVIPESLSKNIFTVDIPPPDTTDLIELAEKVIPEYTQQTIPDNLLRDIALSLKGITLYEAEHVLHGVLSEAKLTRATLLEEIRQTKKPSPPAQDISSTCPATKISNRWAACPT